MESTVIHAVTDGFRSSLASHTGAVDLYVSVGRKDGVTYSLVAARIEDETLVHGISVGPRLAYDTLPDLVAGVLARIANMHPKRRFKFNLMMRSSQLEKIIFKVNKGAIQDIRSKYPEELRGHQIVCNMSTMTDTDERDLTKALIDLLLTSKERHSGEVIPEAIIDLHGTREPDPVTSSPASAEPDSRAAESAMMTMRDRDQDNGLAKGATGVNARVSARIRSLMYALRRG